MVNVNVGFEHPPPILRLNIAYFAVAEGWLLLDIGWFVLFLSSQNCFHILSKVFRNTVKQPPRKVRVIIRCGSFDLVLGHDETYFVKEHSDSKNKYSGDDIINMLECLVDNVFVVFAGKSSSRQLAFQLCSNSWDQFYQTCRIFFRLFNLNTPVGTPGF